MTRIKDFITLSKKHIALGLAVTLTLGVLLPVTGVNAQEQENSLIVQETQDIEQMLSLNTELTSVAILDVSYLAHVVYQANRLNDLTISITEYLSNGINNIIEETFQVENNVSDIFEIGDYKVFVSTQEYTQISEIKIVYNPHFYEEITDEEVELLEYFSYFYNNSFHLIDELSYYLSYEEIERLNYIISASNQRVIDMINYINTTPLSRSGNTLVRHEIEVTDYGLVITQYDALARGPITVKATAWVLSWGIRIAASSNVWGAIGATFSIAGTVMNKNHHLKPVMTNAGHVFTTIGAGSILWRTHAQNFSNRVREIGWELRSINRNIPNSIRPTQMWFHRR